MAGSVGPGHGAGLRVFVSHTSELREFPAGVSYVAAVERAISACRHVIVDMDPQRACARFGEHLIRSKISFVQVSP